MATPPDDPMGSDEEYEDVVEFQCPLCKTPVAEDDDTCPGCGAVFVENEDEATTADSPMESMELDEDVELTEDYELDLEGSIAGMDGDDLDAEIAAMEADLNGDLYEEIDEVDLLGEGEELEAGTYDPDPDHDQEEDLEAGTYELDLDYEEDLEEEEEVEEAFGTAMPVSADDHLFLEELSQPTLMERMFHRAGLGMFIAGGAASVLVILWDSLNGQPLNLGMMQWRFLVLSLSMFIVGFVVELFQAYSLASDDDLYRIDG